MRLPITNKAMMYELLSTGQLGNTIRPYLSIDEWKDSEDYHKFDIWGVRTLTPNGPCRLYCPRNEVEQTVEQFKPHQSNITVMIDAFRRVTLMAEVYMGYSGLEVYGIENPPKGANWRQVMPQAKTYRFMEGRGVLARNLTECDKEDLNELMDMYPNHIIEFSAFDKPIGIYPHRKGVIWEVRCDDGEYEKATWKNKGTFYQRGWSKDGD